MRPRSLLIVALLSACASNPSTPHTCACQGSGFGYVSFGSDTFVDDDDDGIPDRRLPRPEPTSAADQVRQEVARACAATMNAADGQDLDAALEKLAATVAEARRNLSSR